VDVVAKSELPVCAPKVVVGLPNGFGAKGLLAAVEDWPNPCGVPNEVWPNGLVDDCPNAAMKIAYTRGEKIINIAKKKTEKKSILSMQTCKGLQQGKLTILIRYCIVPASIYYTNINEKMMTTEAFFYFICK
jgi:hypothetical protein